MILLIVGVATDAPVGGIEVVGAVAEIFDKSERVAGVCQQNVSAWSGGGECDGLTTQIGYGFVTTHRDSREGLGVE